MKKFYITIFFLASLFFSQKITAQLTCHASFHLDSIASTAFNAVIVNNSTFTTLVPPDSGLYVWLWGDGTSSTTKYPTHTYSSAGVKVVVLFIVDFNKTCSDSIAHTLTIDTSGGFHKTNAAYTVKVVAPTTAGINAKQSEGFVSLSPTVIKEYAKLNFSGLNRDELIKADVFGYDGKNVLSVNEKLTNNTLQLQTGALQNGMYFVVVTAGSNTTLLKFIKQ